MQLLWDFPLEKKKQFLPAAKYLIWNTNIFNRQLKQHVPYNRKWGIKKQSMVMTFSEKLLFPE